MTPIYFLNNQIVKVSCTHNRRKIRHVNDDNSLIILLIYYGCCSLDLPQHVLWRTDKIIFHLSKNEPRHEKTNILVSDLVRHKTGCTGTEDGSRLKILDLESRGIVLSM